jgi:hypothetical protein
MRKLILSKIKNLITAYKQCLLGNTAMPEDFHPKLLSNENNLVYFTLPMSLNYQRNSYKLWESAMRTYDDDETKDVFSLGNISQMSFENLQKKLLKYKVALQPVRHTQNWKTIGSFIFNNWGSIENLLSDSDYDFLKLQSLVQGNFKKQFPYLSGPKIFHYWCYILNQYCNVNLLNSDRIEIAPDTHVIQASVKLGIITKEESKSFSRDEISSIWRKLLADIEIKPIDVHSPLWFWSRNHFKYEI